jgi:probable HAF family extracellular repeat protein
MDKQFEGMSPSSGIRKSWRQALRRLGLQIAALGILAVFCAQRTNAQSYAVTLLRANDTGTTINGRGQVGTFNSDLWTPTTPNGTTGSLIFLPPLPPPGKNWDSLGFIPSVPEAINASGTVVGVTSYYKIITFFSTKYSYTATIWQNGQPVALDTSGSNSAAYGINTASDVVGEIKNTATLWHNGFPTALSTPKKSQSCAQAINDQEQIVGSITDSSGVDHATLWQDGTAYDLGTLLGSSSEGIATSINNAGVITGYAAALDATGATVLHAFVWTPNKANGHKGAMTDLSTLPGLANSKGFSINSSGQVVGYCYDMNGQAAAFLWDSSHGMRDLTSLLPAGSGWTLPVAYGINDSGQIVGGGSNGAFLLTP